MKTGATGIDLKARREAAGMEVLELAVRAGVNPRTIERIEAGQVKPRRATVFVLDAALVANETEAAA